MFPEFSHHLLDLLYPILQIIIGVGQSTLVFSELLNCLRKNIANHLSSLVESSRPCVSPLPALPLARSFGALCHETIYEFALIPGEFLCVSHVENGVSCGHRPPRRICCENVGRPLFFASVPVDKHARFVEASRTLIAEIEARCDRYFHVSLR
jgi:hypothetical protein